MFKANSNRLPSGTQYKAKPQIDLTSHRYGKLTVLYFLARVNKHYYWQCRCDCSNRAVVRARHLRSGATTHCGCVTFRGMHSTGAYRSWVAMRGRVLNAGAVDYPRYGGRGIKICERWSVFKNFFEDMGERPTPKHSIDRTNNEGNYSCGKCAECMANKWESNCKWATMMEQSNNRRANRRISAFGRTLTLAQWARRYGVSAAMIGKRIANKWPTEKAISTPADQRFNRFKQSASALPG